MTETTMDKARLAAFVDGELSPEDAAEVVMHLASNPIDQAYVDEFMALNIMIADAYDAPLYQPVPPAILATIAANGEDTVKKAPVISLADQRRPNRFLTWGGAALAAGIAAFLVAPDQTEPDTATVVAGPLASDHAQSFALNELDAGRSRKIGDDAEFSVTASFETKEKGVCREFRVTREEKANFQVGVACPTPDATGEWTVEVADTVTTDETTTSFTPASGEEADPVSVFLDKVDAGRALTPDEEANARSNGWR